VIGSTLLGTSIALATIGSVGGEITKFDFDIDVVGGRNLSFVVDPPHELFEDREDGFRVYQVGGDTYIPKSLRDDSGNGDPTDKVGIVNIHPMFGKLDKWFGSTDVLNPNNPAGTATASWQFDVSGHPAGVAVSIDMAAMGEFDLITDSPITDAYDWTWSVDGSPPAPLFTSEVMIGGSQTYTLAGGATVSLANPMKMNDVLLKNTFQSLLANVSVGGSVLTIQLHAAADGGQEAFAFDNLAIYALPEPATGLLLAVSVLAARRRR
jgi:hypothetical protein